jgi:hypothetical protein
MPSASPKTMVKPTLPLLKTPASAGATLPSELPRSPLPGFPGWGDFIKREDDGLKTPITPPTAYTEFLKALSPALSTPLTSTSCHTSFGFSDKSGHLTPITQPSSAGSHCSCSCDSRKATAAATATATSAPLVPPSPYMRPLTGCLPSARTPTSLRRLRIPQSPSHCLSPASDSPRSGSALRSPYSPTSWIIDGKTRFYDAPRSAAPRPVSVKQVVTRTVTYTRTPVTPLEPAPKGKRRKME